MDKEQIEKTANAELAKARIIDAFLKSKGWEIYCKLKEEKIRELDSVRECKDLEELEGRKRAIEILEELDAELQGIIDQGTEAQNILNKLIS